MAQGKPQITALVNINNRNTDKTNTPTTVAATAQVVDGQIVADDRQTNPGVLV